MPSRNGAAVIVAFGRKGSQPHARMLARHGYGVLIFDRRGEGHSDGDPNSYGWSDGELDLRAAVDFLQRRPDVDPGRIGGLGLSVGGETFLQAAAHDRRIRAVASEGASARSVGELRSVPGADPLTAATMAGITAGTAVFSNATPPPHLRDLVGRIAPRPMFLIYATKGTGGEEHTFNRAFYREAGRGKAIWEIPESGHVGGLRRVRESMSNGSPASSTGRSEGNTNETHRPARRNELGVFGRLLPVDQRGDPGPPRRAALRRLRPPFGRLRRGGAAPARRALGGRGQPARR